MSARSLRASQAGIQLAKRALARKNLTQKALANERGIASWATVNKFFTGKPVDRLIFQEICTELDLDWEAIAQSGMVDENGSGSVDANDSASPAPGPASDLRFAVQQQAQAAREALTPRILERIPRTVVREKYLPAIARGVESGQKRVIPIIAPAGYGKSTILGDLYDTLTQTGTPWVGLVLCSTLSGTVGFRSLVSYSLLASTFAASIIPSHSGQASPSQLQTSALEAGLGNRLCGKAQPIGPVVQALTTGYGRGVLLIDTLDLVINRESVPVFNQIFRQLVDTGTTLVFTCRDHEYNDFLEPTRERLGGLSQAMLNRHSAQVEREQWLTLMAQPDAGFTQTHWLPVLRQLLTIVESEAEFEALVDRLNHQEVGIFGVIAIAAASRDQPAALRRILPAALEKGEAHQRRLRQALAIASRSLIEQSWDILLTLLEHSEHATAGNTAQLVGALLARWWTGLKQRIPGTIGTMATTDRFRPDPVVEVNP